MNYIKHYDQRDDGGFDYFVVFGNCAPWDADDDMCVKCATEEDASRLIEFLDKMAANVKLTGSPLTEKENSNEQ